MPDLPIVVTTAGLQPQLPATLRALLVAKVASTNPDYSANFGLSLVEDIASTDVGALLTCDGALVELINSLTPYAANAFLLNQLGQLLGVPIGVQSNTSVYVVFTARDSQNNLLPGALIGAGFIVSDGTYQYAIQDGGITASDGQTAPLFALATQSGIWPVAAGTVTQLITSVPPNYTLSVVNPQPGTPGNSSETEASYRARVLQAGKASTAGMYSMLRTALGNVAGVQPRLISAIPQVGGGWLIIVGGGDPYEVAYAIYTALFDISTLVASNQNITGITNANPGVVTLDLNHNYAIGQTFVIATDNPSDYDGTYQALAIPSLTSIALGKAFATNALTALSWSNTGGGEISATTTTAHGVTVGSTFVLSGCAPAGYNGTYVAIAGTTGSTLVAALVSNPGMESVLGTLNAGIANVNTTSTTPWVSGGVVTPNFRNVSATIIDWPDTYPIPFVVPPTETVTMTVTWNTSSPNFVSAAAIAQQGVPAIVAYINSITVGSPINLFELQNVFQVAIANILDPTLLTRMVFAVSINGVGVSPEMGTGIIQGDPQSSLFAVPSGISIVQG